MLVNISSFGNEIRLWENDSTENCLTEKDYLLNENLFRIESLITSTTFTFLKASEKLISASDMFRKLQE